VCCCTSYVPQCPEGQNSRLAHMGNSLRRVTPSALMRSRASEIREPASHLLAAEDPSPIPPFLQYSLLSAELARLKLTNTERMAIHVLDRKGRNVMLTQANRFYYNMTRVSAKVRCKVARSRVPGQPMTVGTDLVDR
jgi:hypothetical protein